MADDGAQNPAAPVQRVPDTYEVRADALEQAVLSWGGPGNDDCTDNHAARVTEVAAAFTQFLTDGTVHQEPAAHNVAEDAGQTGLRIHVEGGLDPLGSLKAGLERIARLNRTSHEIMVAAQAWVDEAHVDNRAGPENWRNWADDKDMRLINAVLDHRGQEKIDQ